MTEALTYQTRDAWLSARQTLGIGSSDAPVILGLSRYATPFVLYNEKLGLVARSEKESEQLAWGNILEEPIAQRYALVTGRSVRNPRVPGTFTIERSKKNDFMIAAVDRYTLAKPDEPDVLPMQRTSEGVLEIKNASIFMANDWLDLQEPPVEFQVQVQHQMAVTGAQWGSIACLIGGSTFVWKDIARDDEFIDMLIEKEREFWNRLLNREPPPIDGSNLTRAVIGKMHPRDTGTVIELPPDAADLIADRAVLKTAEKQNTDAINEVESKLKAILGDNTAGTLRDGTVVTWKWQARAAHQVKATEFRQLRVTAPKGAKTLQ